MCATVQWEAYGSKGPKTWRVESRGVRKLERGCSARKKEANQSYRRQAEGRQVTEKGQRRRHQSEPLENLERQSTGLGERINSLEGVSYKGPCQGCTGVDCLLCWADLDANQQGKEERSVWG